ncbi:Lipid carrier : UDP-N-acetylgalactosaminyltransferase / Alpha-1,3-N-acetylgalactosamine transferase PglA; Putative glycosyltransferase [hydrothermal vent metagenome]|uniref:Lipid carrier: UDP-N-acetylgalactosaminyltransferase / Alpha-1,3-N-acetylgalactosamine transferase PglA Putative glycosyltransferase n=1 Tax=hydrothermal vent metagenome TaxID=652676 RepID=A0A1W1C2W8_9ZZZZ
MNKTIAIVINTSWNIYNFRLGLIKALQKEGYKVIAIAPKDEYSKKLEELGIKHYDIEMNNKGTNPFEDIKLIFDFYKLYKELSPDVILQYTIKPNIYGSIGAKMAGVPVISNISGLGTVFLNDNISSKIARMLYKFALKFPEKIFFQNKDDRELFISLGLVAKNKTDLLPGSGIDTQKFKPIKVERDDKRVKFLFVARLVKDKGLVEYVEAARQFLGNDKVEFCILGAFYNANPTAIRASKIQEWEEKGFVKYLGTSDDVKTVISEADCIVLPSYREGLSRVLLEAASMAKPIITSNVPGCKEVVDDSVNGYLCEVKNANSLAEQMKKMHLLSNKERYEMGRRGREKVIKEFDEKIVIQKYSEVIKSLME